jgi:hypothetical protein
MRLALRISIGLAGIAVLLLAIAIAAAMVMTTVPGRPYAGALPSLTSDESALAIRLQKHVEAIGSRPHNIEHFEELEKTALHIEATLAAAGHQVNRHSFQADGKTVRNIEVVLPSAAGDGPDVPTIVVGAHYDSCEDAPGANDNASGVAAVLELASLLKDLAGSAGKRIRLVLFVNEEPPYFHTPDMGSVRYADALAARGENVVAMYALDDVGFFSAEPGSQHYPPPFGMVFGNTGDFVAFVAMSGSRDLLDRTVASFRSHTDFPSVGGVAPGFIPGVDWSDHWSFARRGFPAVMITDTAIFRYPHYHQPTDTPDKVEVEKLARLVKGIERLIRDIAK